MKIFFTDHAKLRMKERNITIDDICEALQNQEIKMPANLGAFKIYSSIRKGKICVVYVEKMIDIFKIISAWWR